MPTIPMFDVPPPEDWREFEKMTRDALAQRWSSPNLEMHGRQGQAQNGVDIYGDDHLVQFVGVQCKCSPAIALATVEAEVKFASTFKPPISALYVAVAGDRDASLQKEVRMLSAKRMKKGKFPVALLFWPDVFSELAGAPALIAKYYPTLSPTGLGSERPAGSRLAAALDAGFYGRNTDQYLELMFGEIGFISGQDPNEFLSLALLVAGAGRVILPNELAGRVVNRLDDLVKIVVKREAKPPDWSAASALAKEVDAIFESVETQLGPKELAAYRLGSLLGRWGFILTRNKTLGKELERSLLAAVAALALSDDYRKAIIDALREARKDESVAIVHLPARAYGRARTLLLTQAMTVSSSTPMSRKGASRSASKPNPPTRKMDKKPKAPK